MSLNGEGTGKIWGRADVAARLPTRHSAVMHRIRLAAFFLTALAACGSASPPEPPHNRPALVAILQETKFSPHGDYTGADTPEDQAPLRAAVDDTIRDVDAMPDPLEAGEVRSRLSQLLEKTDAFATEDRDEVGRYAVRIWRAAGFKEDSRLFPVGDNRALALP